MRERRKDGSVIIREGVEREGMRRAELDCAQCVRASTESNDQGNSIFVKRLETFVLSAI